jgi:hypothetical protein
MKPIAKKDFQLNGIYYAKGDEINVKNKEELIKLNEVGVIEPLTGKEIQDFFKKPITKKEE